MSSLPEHFVRWSGSHLAVITIIVLLCLSIIITGKKATLTTRYTLCRCLAAIIAATFIAEHIGNAIILPHDEWIQHLPLHFCSIMAPVSVIALWTRKRWACSVVYFGVLAASIQALITPTLQESFPHIRFWVFFSSHGLLAIGAIAVAFATEWRARFKDVWRSVLLMDAYLLAVIPINVALGTNYGFTQYSPVSGSILDYLGSAPWYYLWLQIPAFLLFYIMHLFVKEKAVKQAA